MVETFSHAGYVREVEKARQETENAIGAKYADRVRGLSEKLTVDIYS